MLFGFVGGDAPAATRRCPPAGRRAACWRNSLHLFGVQARQPREFLETSWGEEEWTRGCPVGHPGSRPLVTYGPHLRRPVGRLHWAGTETATYWNGYMDGAVSSGERAAPRWAEL